MGKNEATELDPVEEGARPNPRFVRMRGIGGKALKVAVIGGVGAVMFLAVDPQVEKQVAADVSKDTSGDKIGAEVKSRNTWGLGEVLGGIAVGVLGQMVDRGLVGDAITGAGVGLIIDGAVQLSAADKLKKARRVMA